MKMNRDPGESHLLCAYILRLPPQYSSESTSVQHMFECYMNAATQVCPSCTRSRKGSCNRDRPSVRRLPVQTSASGCSSHESSPFSCRGHLFCSSIPRKMRPLPLFLPPLLRPSPFQPPASLSRQH